MCRVPPSSLCRQQPVPRWGDPRRSRRPPARRGPHHGLDARRNQPPRRLRRRLRGLPLGGRARHGAGEEDAGAARSRSVEEDDEPPRTPESPTRRPAPESTTRAEGPVRSARAEVPAPSVEPEVPRPVGQGTCPRTVDRLGAGKPPRASRNGPRARSSRTEWGRAGCAIRVVRRATRPPAATPQQRCSSLGVPTTSVSSSPPSTSRCSSVNGARISSAADRRAPRSSRSASRPSSVTSIRITLRLVGSGTGRRPPARLQAVDQRGHGPGHHLQALGEIRHARR